MESTPATNAAAKQMLRHLSRVGSEECLEHMSSNLARAGISDQGSLRYWALKLVSAPFFDFVMGVVIVFNLVVMIIETDLSTMEDEDAGSTLYWTEVVGWMVLFVFIFELVIRLLVFRCVFFKEPWNVFDFVIVVTDTVFSVLGLIVGNTFPVSILRIFRLTKLARVSKVLRVFPELRLLLAGLLSSLSAIFWGTLLLFFCLMVWSMVAVLFIHPLNKNIDYDGCDRCHRAYSSVMQATLTFWQQIVTGDSWGQATIPLIEKHPSTAIFFIPVFLSVGMAVMNLILGVVVSVAEQAKDEMRTEENAERDLLKLEKQTHLFELCRQMDTDQTGKLTREEVYAGLDDLGEFQESMSALGISKEDFDIAWAIMDTDRSGKISYKEFVCNLCKMRSSDTEFMLAYLKCYITEIRNTVLQVMKNQHAEAMDMEHKVEQEIAKIEQQEETILEDEEMILAIEMRQKTPGSDRSDIRQLNEQTSQRGKEEKLQELAGLRIHPGERTIHSSSKCDKTAAPVTDMCDRLQNPLSGGVSQDGNDETQVWLKNVCNEIGTMRIEFKDMLLDIRRKLGPAESPFSLMQQDSVPTERRVLGVLP